MRQGRIRWDLDAFALHEVILSDAYVEATLNELRADLIQLRADHGSLMASLQESVADLWMSAVSKSGTRFGPEIRERSAVVSSLG